MAAPASWDWLYHLLGYSLAAAGLVLLLWALFWDRSRGRRRCPKCWYDMSATPGVKCPECGREARSERRLFRTRRRWRLAALALLVVPGAYLVHSWPLVKAGGWLAPIPTRLLLEIYPWSGPGTRLGDELLSRSWLIIRPSGPYTAPTDEQLTSLITQAARGNWLARPVSGRWKRSYGELLRLLGTRVMSRDGKLEVYPGPRFITGSIDPALQEWLSVPAATQVHTRSKWPRGMPITIASGAETWWPQWVTNSEEIAWSASGGQAKGKGGFRMYSALKIDLEGHIVVEGTIKVFQRDAMMRDQNKREAANAPFRFEYDTVDSIDDIMQAAGSPEFDAFLASCMTAVWTDRSSIQFTATKPVPPGYDDVAFGAVLEVLAGDRILLTAHSRCIGLTNFVNSFGTFGDVTTLDNDPDAARLGRGDIDPSWRLRIRTDPQRALSELDATRYWKGDITVPLAAGKFNMRVRTTTIPPPANAKPVPAPPPK